MADTSITLSGSSLRESFSHTLYGWVGEFILDPLKDESLVGFEVISGSIPISEGDVSLEPKSNTVKANSDYDGADDTTTVVFKGIYLDESTFEAAHSPSNGIAYYDETNDVGKVYYDGTYYTINYDNIQYGADFGGEFGMGLFPNTSIKWKDIITGEEKEKAGWPPPEDDPMSRFLFSIDLDSTASKTRSVTIRYDVKIVTETPGSAGPPVVDPTFATTYRSDVYTYTKTITNTTVDIISSDLETFFDQFPEIDYTTGEIIGE